MPSATYGSHRRLLHDLSGGGTGRILDELLIRRKGRDDMTESLGRAENSEDTTIGSGVRSGDDTVDGWSSNRNSLALLWL